MSLFADFVWQHTLTNNLNQLFHYKKYTYTRFKSLCISCLHWYRYNHDLVNNSFNLQCPHYLCHKIKKTQNIMALHNGLFDTS